MNRPDILAEDGWQPFRFFPEFSTTPPSTGVARLTRTGKNSGEYAFSGGSDTVSPRMADSGESQRNVIDLPRTGIAFFLLYCCPIGEQFENY